MRQPSHREMFRLRCAALNMTTRGARFLRPRALKRGNDGAWGIVIPSEAEESLGRRPVVRQPSPREMFRLRCAALNMTTRGARFLRPRALKRGNDGAWGIVIPSGAEESLGRRPVVRQPSPREMFRLRCAALNMTTRGGEVPASARAEARERRGMGHCHSERNRGISRETPRRAPTFSPRDVSTPLRCAQHDNEGARFLPPPTLTERCFDSAALRST